MPLPRDSQARSPPADRRGRVTADLRSRFGKTEPVTDPIKPAPWSVLHFSQSNPEGAGQGLVSALLRRVADSIDELGDVDVQDIVFHIEVTAGEDDLTMTVYYHDQSRPR